VEGANNAQDRQGNPRGSNHKTSESAAPGGWQSLLSRRRPCIDALIPGGHLSVGVVRAKDSFWNVDPRAGLLIF
jgi:hypothetical protein